MRIMNMLVEQRKNIKQARLVFKNNEFSSSKVINFKNCSPSNIQLSIATQCLKYFRWKTTHESKKHLATPLYTDKIFFVL